MEAPETNTVLGIARKLNKELEEIPLSAHGAVVAILTTLIQHRADVERGKQVEEQRKREIQAQFDPRVAMVPRQQ
jgi:hypothetical protein